MDGIGFDRTPLSDRVKAIVRKAVVDGEYRPGDLLPSQNEMAREFGVSSHTIREAIASLVHEGLLYKRHGKGTFVAERKLDRSTIGFVTTRLHRDLGTHYRLGYNNVPLLVQYVQEAARDRGAGLMLELDHDDADVEREALLRMLERRVGGLIVDYIGGKSSLDVLKKIRSSGIPLVLVDKRADGIDTDYVATDNFKGAYRSVEHLLRLGLRRIYHFTVQSDSSALRERLDGYRQALADHGVPFDPSLVRHACSDVFPNLAMGNDFHESFRLAKETLAEASRPFGVFAANGAITAGVWRAILQLGISNRDIGLASFDVPMESIPLDVEIIKVVQPLREIALSCVELISESQNGRTDPRHVVLEPSYRMANRGRKLEVRGSAHPAGTEPVWQPWPVSERVW